MSLRLHSLGEAALLCELPAGSVGIGGAQTGVYPIASPGGWQLIGRTSLVLFDPLAAEPTLLRRGWNSRWGPANCASRSIPASP